MMKKEYIIKINHWFDKTNGNPYFSARIYDLTMKLLKVVPFQYGNRSHAEDTVTAHVQANNAVHEIKNTVFQKCYIDHTYRPFGAGGGSLFFSLSKRRSMEKGMTYYIVI